MVGSDLINGQKVWKMLDIRRCERCVRKSTSREGGGNLIIVQKISENVRILQERVEKK